MSIAESEDGLFDRVWSGVAPDSPSNSASTPDSEDVGILLREVMKKAGEGSPAGRMVACAQDAELVFDCNGCGNSHYVAYHCDNRVCPNCGKIRAAAIFSNFYKRVISRLDLANLQFTTLTFRNTETMNGDILDAARACFKRLRRREVWNGQKGGLYAFEDPHAGGGEHNLHLHILSEGVPLETDNPDSVGGESLEDAWREITRRVDGVPESWIVDSIRLCKKANNNAGAANYVTKYLTKNPELFDSEDGRELSVKERVRFLYEYHDTFHNANMVQTFGHCHHSSDHAVSLRWDAEDTDGLECDNCGSKDWDLREGVMFHNVMHSWWMLRFVAGLGPG